MQTVLRIAGSLLATISLSAGAQTAPAAAPHTVGLSKHIVSDLPKTQTFYEEMFGMKEVGHYRAKGVYDEPIMGFASGARLALFAPEAEVPLPKSQYPVTLIYTPEFDALTARIAAAKHPVTHLPAAQSGTFRIAITRDPSGNAVEILARADKPTELGGAKLIVRDLQIAEDFYTRVFEVKPIQRYKAPTYDEVLLGFGDGPWLALFQPKNEQALPKSRFPVVAIYTTQFDQVVANIEKEGLGYRTVASPSAKMRIIVAQDPSGNAVEIISR